MDKVDQGRIQGCLAGVAIGDALGMPVEMMTPAEILQATGGAGVTDLLSPIQRRIKGTQGLAPGATTDDTQLTFAVARALIDCRDFKIARQALELVIAYEKNDFGWGRSTRKAAKELRAYLADGGRSPGVGRHPELPVPPPVKPGDGCGNGVAMKIAPLAVFHALGGGFPEPFLSDAMALGLMTHGDPRASFAAAALGAAIDAVLSNRCKPCDGFCLRHLVLRQAVQTAERLEFRYQFFRNNAADTLSARLKVLWNSLGDAAGLRDKAGTGCFALESVPFAIGTFLRHPADFRRGVLEAVNAGGDADSTASMVGALIGANVGLANLPPEWTGRVPAVAQALKIADELTAAAR